MKKLYNRKRAVKASHVDLDTLELRPLSDVYRDMDEERIQERVAQQSIRIKLDELKSAIIKGIDDLKHGNVSLDEFRTDVSNLVLKYKQDTRLYDRFESERQLRNLFDYIRKFYL